MNRRDKNPPPACNTGVENKSVSQRIHWIEVTFKDSASVKLPEILSREGKECTPFHGYTIGYKYGDGRVELTNPNRPDMGHHIQWSGGVLDSLDVNPLELVRFLREAGAKFTRIDLATDAMGYGLKAEDAKGQIENGEINTHARQFPYAGKAGASGFTQYVGTQASEIFVRIYDKAAEMGLSGDHTRVELVCKGFRAQKAVDAILSGTDFRGLVVGFVRFPSWGEWNEVMEANAVTLPADKKDSNTKIWLLKQCAPALAKIICDDGDGEFYARFKDSVFDLVAEEVRKRE